MGIFQAMKLVLKHDKAPLAGSAVVDTREHLASVKCNHCDGRTNALHKQNGENVKPSVARDYPVCMTYVGNSVKQYHRDLDAAINLCQLLATEFRGYWRPARFKPQIPDGETKQSKNKPAQLGVDNRKTIPYV